MDNEPIISFRDVCYTPDDTTVLHRLNLDVYGGETLVLLGESGCGKTTTLRLINRLLLPTEGTVEVEGRSTRAWNENDLRRRIGYVIQDGGLFPHFTVERNIGLVPQLLGWQADKIKARVQEMLNVVGLATERYAHRLPHELSGGQRQRVGVARALAADPHILLLDEPFGALDPLTRAELQNEFKRLAASLGKTTVFVTHDVREALMLGSRVALMKAGDIAVLATPEQFLAADDPTARAYLATLELPTTTASHNPPNASATTQSGVNK
jgi:osmoprotectant transport system ATP-binding protein